MKLYLIGVDEAGRGPIAGPVVAAAILCDDSVNALPVTDSKLMSAKKRESCFEYLIKNYKYSVAVVEAPCIDKINILNATKQAMSMAIQDLWQFHKCKTLIDGNFIPFEDVDLECIIKGDLKVKAISAASVIAKVTRDKIMHDLAKIYPQYGWVKNAGYGTKSHYAAINDNGLTEFHRRSFLKKIIGGNAAN